MSPIAEVQALLETQSDVKRVVLLDPAGDRFRYLIETPFKTFPKYVMGTTDKAGKDVRILHKCGLLDSAMQAWGIVTQAELKRRIQRRLETFSHKRPDLIFTEFWWAQEIHHDYSHQVRHALEELAAEGLIESEDINGEMHWGRR